MVLYRKSNAVHPGVGGGEEGEEEEGNPSKCSTHLNMIQLWFIKAGIGIPFTLGFWVQSVLSMLAKSSFCAPEQ